ncbi:MAG: ribonuclease III [Terracidiphilus sp.]
MDGVLAELEAELGHGFARRELLVCALTHRSLVNETAANEKASNEKAEGGRATIERVTAQGQEEAPAAEDNERLEFLGDAVLGLVVAEAMFEAHPEWHEGELTRVRAQLVSRRHLAEVAAAINLGSYLRLSRGEERGGLRSKSTVLSNSMEAVLGALFLDGGLEPVRAFARRYVMGEAAEQLAEELRSGAALGNYKSALQEYAQSTHLGTPVYRVKGESGPDHRKRFLVEVRLQGENGKTGQPLARGRGTTKKLAEQDAARRAVEGLKTGEFTIGNALSDAEEQEEE